MFLAEFTTVGFKVPDATYSFRRTSGASAGDGRPRFFAISGTASEPHELVILKGAPGVGKTLFLRLLGGLKEAFAPIGSAPDFRTFLRPGQPTGKLTATFVLNEVERIRAKVTSAEQKVVVDVEPAGATCSADPNLEHAFVPVDKTAAFTRWEFFPACRYLRLSDFGRAHPPLSSDLEAARRLTSDSDKYAVIRRVFYELALSQAAGIASALDSRGVALRGDEPDFFAPYKAAVATMAPHLRMVNVELCPGSAIPIFARRTGERVPIFELTHTEEQSVLFAFAYVWLSLNQAIVLIDTPELLQPPSEQAHFFSRLLTLGRGNQTFVSTASSDIAAFPSAVVIDLSKITGGKP